ncbi:MAG: hypothetical protein AAF197_04340 [Pseudomonadota bacterium]
MRERIMSMQDQKSGLHQLNWDLEPDRDLWPSIEARLEARSEQLPSRTNRHAPPLWMSLAMAACVILAIGSVTISYLSMQQNNRYMQMQASILMQHQKTIRSIEVQHEEVKAQLVTLLSNQNAHLNPRLVAEANSILSTTQSASSQIKRAIENHPDQQDYLTMLVKIYQQEAELLKRIQLSQELSI